MTNEEKAKEIAYNDTLYGEDPDNNSKTDECYIAAMAMSEWKDELYKEEKEALQETINALDASLKIANEHGMYYFDKCNVQKQHLIDKAWQWIVRYFVCAGSLDFKKEMERAFRKEMEE